MLDMRYIILTLLTISRITVHTVQESATTYIAYVENSKIYLKWWLEFDMNKN